MNDQIPWNDALGDVFLISDIERNAIESYMDNNIAMYYKWIRAYLQKLCSMVEIDRKSYLKRLKNIRDEIWGENNFEDEEFEQAASEGKGIEDLEEIYFELASIKVKAGLSVDKKKIEQEEKKRMKKEFTKDFPVLELN